MCDLIRRRAGAEPQSENTLIPRVLHVIATLNYGGIETWLLQIARLLDRSRYQIDILVESDQRHDYTDDFVAAGCRVLPCFGAPNPWTYANNFSSVYRQFGPYDIVHSHAHYFSSLVLALAKDVGVPVRIFHAHPVGDLKTPSIWRTAYRRVALSMIRRNATHVLACSKTTLGAFRKATRLSIPCAVQYNSVDFGRFQSKIDRASARQRLGLPMNGSVIAYVARFVHHKNHKQVFRIADSFQSMGRPVHFALVGSHGPLLDFAKAEAARRRNVSVLTSIGDVAEVLQASDAFFFPSLEEGFGIVALEAAAAGLPTIAAGWDSIREACAPSHRELMFQPDNDEEAIARLERVLNDPLLQESLGRDGREWAQKFSVEASLRTLMQFYDGATSREMKLKLRSAEDSFNEGLRCTGASLHQYAGRARMDVHTKSL